MEKKIYEAQFLKYSIDALEKDKSDRASQSATQHKISENEET